MSPGKAVSQKSKKIHEHLDPNIPAAEAGSSKMSRPLNAPTALNTGSSSSEAPVIGTVDELKVKLERSREAIKKLNQCIGTTNVASSSTGTSDDDFSSNSHEVEQEDCTFGKSYVFTTNVSFDH